MVRRRRSPTEDEVTATKPSPRTPLTRERVLRAALEIVDTEGVEALSMRRLAHDLDREAMSLYRYASSKADLLDGVVELVLGELTIDPGAQDWRDELRQLARNFRSLALAHPNTVALLVTRPLATPLGQRSPGVLRPLENFLELLVRAGFTAAQALHAYRLYFGFLNGHILDELQEVVDNPDESDYLLRLGLHRFPREQFPQLRAVAPDLATYDGAAHLEHGVNMMLTGLQSHFRPADDHQPTGEGPL